MNALVEFARNTLIGGLLFLLPLGFLILIGGELFSAVDGVSDAVQSVVFPNSDLSIISTLISVVILLAIAFFAGLLARTTLGTLITSKFDRIASMNIPGYGAVRQIIQDITGHSDHMANEGRDKMQIVRVKVGNIERFGVVIGPAEKEEVVVFLPNSPNAFAGIVVVANTKDITNTTLKTKDIIQGMNMRGRGLIDAGST